MNSGLAGQMGKVAVAVAIIALIVIVGYLLFGFFTKVDTTQGLPVGTVVAEYTQYLGKTITVKGYYQRVGVITDVSSNLTRTPAGPFLMANISALPTPPLENVLYLFTGTLQAIGNATGVTEPALRLDVSAIERL